MAALTDPVPPVLGATGGETEQARRAALRWMKTLATALLIVAAVIYACTLDRDGVLGFVNAGAEAAMVGALADWFAVTALFKHPLGLPIPHTALIKTRKDALGASLEEFVSTNFLSEPVVRDKLARADIARRGGAWLADPAHARRVSAELATAGRAVLERVRDDDVVFLIENVLLPRAGQFPVAQVSGSMLDGVLDDGTHRPLIDLGLDQLVTWLRDNRERVEELVTDQAPGWTPQWVDNRVASRIYREMLEWAEEMRADERHAARRALDDLLRRFAHNLQHDEGTRTQVESLLVRLLENPELRRATLDVWATVRRLLVEATEDADGELRRRMDAAVIELGTRLGDPGGELRQRVDDFIGDVAGYVVRGFAPEIAGVISDTVQRWDVDEASDMIELYVGRDLQFIRINGTVVGATAGVLIHAVTVLVS